MNDPNPLLNLVRFFLVRLRRVLLSRGHARMRCVVFVVETAHVVELVLFRVELLE